VEEGQDFTQLQRSWTLAHVEMNSLCGTSLVTFTCRVKTLSVLGTDL
jgi:hypothetical protein